VFADGSGFVARLYIMPHFGYLWSKPRLAHSPHGFDNSSGGFLIGLV
jgi:hypothetical protein